VRALLEVSDLRTSFTTHGGVARAVDGISFSIEEGETVGIVGESGCGKTVTSLSILGLIPDPPGKIAAGSSIRFDGEELLEASSKRLREVRGNDISMIFQEPMTSLNPVFTVGNQIAEVLRLHRGMSRAEARAAGVGLLEEVGISDPDQRFDEYPHQLSGGMVQRVMIAMAISCEPRLLIADEPTTALDVTIQAQILDLLVGMREKHGMALLLITHDLGVIGEVCDRVLVMYAGQIVETGTVEEILGDPRHPYTQGLLASLPDLVERGQPLTPIPGGVPDPVNWPEACRFRERCPSAWEKCRVSSPESFPIESASDRTARCWLAESPEAHGSPKPDEVST